ncbi:hypothetical protein OUZ56_012011 [Daphnia magna]|uniref:Uncharacterized protein n=1 Tax=Daphnia magna TaxID=35525 RepID=A0ABQ9Z1S4_9CRUS|nr:hypothetical protein OUZ56_012011 [Daphnia magna]
MDELVKLNKNVEQLSTESTAIVHVLQVHPLLINHTNWEIRASTQVISKLQVSCDALDREISKVEIRFGNVHKEMENQWVAMGKGMEDDLPYGRQMRVYHKLASGKVAFVTTFLLGGVAVAGRSCCGLLHSFPPSTRRNWSSNFVLSVVRFSSSPYFFPASGVTMYLKNTKEMEVDSFQFLLRQRGSFDDVLKIIGALLFSSPFGFYAQFQPEDKELIVHQYPGYAGYRDLYPQHLARLLW